MQRRQLMPAFAYRHIKELYPIFWQKSVELANALSRSSAANGGEVEISHWFARATLDIIGVAGLGEDFGMIQRPEHELMYAYSAVFQQKLPESKIKVLALVLREAMARLLPFERNDTIAQATKTLKGVAGRLIQQKKAQEQSGNAPTKKDLLSVLMHSSIFDEAMMANQLLTFLAAGHETTATSLTWAAFALCQRPDVQDRLRQEIRAHVPKTTDGAHAKPEVFDSLSYLHAVCNEVLRLYPPAGLTKRVAVKDTSILEQRVPKGTTVMVVMRAINHSKQLWGDDATEFRPERWLEHSNGGAESNFAFMTFLHGWYLTSFLMCSGWLMTGRSTLLHRTKFRSRGICRSPCGLCRLL